MNKIAFVGAGNMERAMIQGLVAQGQTDIIVSNPHADKIKALQEDFNVHIARDNVDCVEQADVVVFAVKPQVLSSVLKECREAIVARKPLVISIAAGVRLSAMASILGNDISLVRCMPNTAATIGQSATALCANAAVDSDQREQAQALMSAIGITAWCASKK